jgi:hypothetical protein
MISRRNFLKRLGIGMSAAAYIGTAPYLPNVYDKSKVVPASTVKVVSNEGGIVIREFIAGSEILKGQIVAIDTDGKAYPIDPLNYKQIPIGLALDDATIPCYGGLCNG